MKPEEEARKRIDAQLQAAGWRVQDMNTVNLAASRGIAIREFPLKNGTADYLLFADRQAVGVVEAKPVGATLSGVADQSEKYTTGIPQDIPHVKEPLPFVYESTGVETFFRNLRDPDPCSRRVFNFHQPATLGAWSTEEETLRARLRHLPPLVTDGLRDCQIEAIRNLERSFAEARPRALIQMATGSGKTFAAVSFIYRLIKFSGARRVLFLVDRSFLGNQARGEFQEYVTLDDGRKFTELYNVQHLTTNVLDPVARVCITTIQRLYSMLKGEPEYDPENEEGSMFQVEPLIGKPVEVAYTPDISIECFDFIVTDECHRFIYNLWRQVLEYFDAFLIGLTATPSKQTLGFFNQNLVTEYSHERAVADGVNVGYDVYRIRTQITEDGSKVEAGHYVDKRDKLTRDVRWEQLDEDLEYTARQLDRDGVARDQIRTVVRAFRDKLFTEIFPGRKEVPKTLIFAKDDSHAEDIVHIVREEFGRGNDFCKKITYRTTGETPATLIRSFRNSPLPRIAVTVDMVFTGTDIKPLECLVFMRNVKSAVYFEQMKGRGTRTIAPTDFQVVTPGSPHKTHFVIVDAVGVCEHDKTDSRPLERKKSVPFDKLMNSIAFGSRDEDVMSSVAGRLARLDRELTDADRQEIEQASGGNPLKDLINGLLDALDPDVRLAEAQGHCGTETPTEAQLAETAGRLKDEACEPFNEPELRNLLIEVHRRNEQTIDNVSQDTIIEAGFDAGAKERAQTIVSAFKQFIEDNKYELTALQILYSKPYGQRHLGYEQIKELAQAIERPPYGLTADRLWQAYEQLGRSKVRGAGPQRLLTDIISLLRFALGESEVLEPFSEVVNARFAGWLADQEAAGRRFTEEQMEWLRMIRGHVAASLSIGIQDFEYAPFHEKGGPVKVYQVFGGELDELLVELNEALVA